MLRLQPHELFASLQGLDTTVRAPQVRPTEAVEPWRSHQSHARAVRDARRRGCFHQHQVPLTDTSDRIALKEIIADI